MTANPQGQPEIIPEPQVPDLESFLQTGIPSSSSPRMEAAMILSLCWDWRNKPEESLVTWGWWSGQNRLKNRDFLSSLSLSSPTGEAQEIKQRNLWRLSCVATLIWNREGSQILWNTRVVSILSIKYLMEKTVLHVWYLGNTDLFLRKECSLSWENVTKILWDIQLAPKQGFFTRKVIRMQGGHLGKPSECSLTWFCLSKYRNISTPLLGLYIP